MKIVTDFIEEPSQSGLLLEANNGLLPSNTFIRVCQSKVYVLLLYTKLTDIMKYFTQIPCCVPIHEAFKGQTKHK